MTSTNNNKKRTHEWIKAKKDLAHFQLENLDKYIDVVFTEANFTSFLQLVSRMPYYCYQNLLIIYNSYPEATCLAGFATWQRKMLESGKSEASTVLRPNGINNGINLIAPFTNDLGNGDYSLSWYCVLMFDISQTFVQDYTLRPPVFVQDSYHLTRVLDSVTEILSSSFNLRIIFEPYSSPLSSAGLPGRITGEFITVRRDLDDEALLLWLTDIMCGLFIDRPSLLSPQSEKVLQQCICYCLYLIWGFDPPLLLSGTYTLIPEQERTIFLDQLQSIVFKIYQESAGHYLLLSSKDDFEDFSHIFSKFK